jgi:hypothetical protein
MPYINQEDRKKFASHALGQKVTTMGELNYVLTSVIEGFRSTLPKVGYTELNAIDGVLGQVQAEFRRRVIAPYEDRKIIENGDVYGGI